MTMVFASDVATLSRYLYALAAMARPAFLLGTLPIYAAGVTLAGHEGHDVRLPAAVFGLALVWTVQLATHYNNEYRDVETDAAIAEPTRIAGGSRVLVSGVVPRNAARVAALATLALAVLVSLAVTAVLDVGPLVLVLAGAAIVGGWFYSSPPLALVSRGVGEVTVAIVTGGLVPATAYYLQTSTLSVDLWVVCLPVVPFAFAASIATALPDVDADRATGKETLAVRVGRRRAVHLLVAAVVTGWASLAYVAASIGSGIGPSVLLVAPVLVGAIALSAPDAARDSVGAAETLAVTTVANLGWASLATCVLLF